MYTECCLDCGINIYESDSERVIRLQAEIKNLRKKQLEKLGDQLEDERDRLLKELLPEPDPNDGSTTGGW